MIIAVHGKCYIHANMGKYDVDQLVFGSEKKAISQLFYNPLDNLITVYYQNDSLYFFSSRNQLEEHEIEKFKEKFLTNPVAMDFLKYLPFFKEEVEKLFAEEDASISFS